MKLDRLRRFFTEPFITVRIVPTACLPCLRAVGKAPYDRHPGAIVIWFDLARKLRRP